MCDNGPGFGADTIFQQKEFIKRQLLTKYYATDTSDTRKANLTNKLTDLLIYIIEVHVHG